MPPVLAICQRCGTAFSSGIFIANSTNVRMEGNTSTCPKCGGVGRVPDGRYDATEDSIRIMATSANSLESLRRLEAVLRQVNRPGVTKQAVAEAILTQAPEFSALAPVVERRSVDVTIWILILLTAILVWQGMRAESSRGATPEQIREIYRQVVRQTQSQVRPSPSLNRVPLVSPLPSPTQSRNSLCRCGSGKKFKRCHGRVPMRRVG